ncbi:hypothetical protein F5J12DRAFT_114517 [Pisolithus orientalis]|uniref:uncharacterized protein n=1 Tax=Pisolithus orientalis TaxID=936130 RepID=UPI0022240D37|nr:uncharacterized protein F5J12DRAFT_114517 [Pisolithus orientalis]KAI6006295.1 hypothetical protein F5J12DRAFT_114517 [Pisolithus orientalis]
MEYAFFAFFLFLLLNISQHVSSHNSSKILTKFSLLPECMQPIEHGSSFISIPTLSMSRQPSLMALAEHGIGCVIVFEYLFFQLQVTDGGTTRQDVQQDLTVIVRTYQKSGVQNTVIACIAEAFQQHGESVDDLCAMLVGIAQANQMSKKFLK